MLVRLGRVLFWAGLFVALMTVGISAFVAYKAEDFITALVVAATFVGVGRGARYILAGE